MVCWTILLSVSQCKLRTTTVTSDDSVVWNVVEVPWFQQLFRARSTADPDGIVWF